MNPGSSHYATHAHLASPGLGEHISVPFLIFSILSVCQDCECSEGWPWVLHLCNPGGLVSRSEGKGPGRQGSSGTLRGRSERHIDATSLTAKGLGIETLPSAFSPCVPHVLSCPYTGMRVAHSNMQRCAVYTYANMHLHFCK